MWNRIAMQCLHRCRWSKPTCLKLPGHDCPDGGLGLKKDSGIGRSILEGKRAHIAPVNPCRRGTEAGGSRHIGAQQPSCTSTAVGSSIGAAVGAAVGTKVAAESAVASAVTTTCVVCWRGVRAWRAGNRSARQIAGLSDWWIPCHSAHTVR